MKVTSVSLGNRTSSHLSTNCTYQPFNRLKTSQTSSHVYDPNGNMASKSEGSKLWNYFYDHENRLSRAADRRVNVTYKYDALGRRVERNRGYGTEQSKFTHDGEDVVVEDANGTVLKYQNGPGIDNKLSVKQGSVTNYFLADHLGSTNALTDSTGAITASQTYDSFGNGTNAAFPTRYQFTGREYDPAIGLQYSRARFYDPKLGRFISEDPIGFAGGDVNLYGYVGNNPTNGTDPFGLYVVIFFNVRTGNIRAWDIRPGENYAQRIQQRPDFEYGNAFSGDKECKNNSACDLVKNEGPIPRGSYAIDGSVNSSGEGWRRHSFRLYRQTRGTFMDTDYGIYRHWDTPIGDSGVERGGFYLHPGTVSWGCVTIPEADRAHYDRLRALLENTSKIQFLENKTYTNGMRTGSGFVYVY